MKKAKIISALGTTDFETKLNEWLADNKENEIISINHSATDTPMPSNGGTMFFASFTALIIYVEKEVSKPGNIKVRLPYIDNIPSNDLKGML